MDGERRDDWRHGVDENLASLNASQRVWDRELVIIRKLLGEFDHLLRGNPEKETAGIIERFHAIETDVSRLNAVIFVDSTGKKGALKDLQDLKSGAYTSQERWKFATAVMVAVLSLLGLLLTNWGRISAYFGPAARPGSPEAAIEQAEHPKARHKHYVIREDSAE